MRLLSRDCHQFVQFLSGAAVYRRCKRSCAASGRARLQSLRASIKLVFSSKWKPQAGMAELADAADSKSADLRVLGVRLPLPAPSLLISVT
jgi:hypothetical protein